VERVAGTVEFQTEGCAVENVQARQTTEGEGPLAVEGPPTGRQNGETELNVLALDTKRFRIVASVSVPCGPAAKERLQAIRAHEEFVILARERQMPAQLDDVRHRQLNAVRIKLDEGIVLGVRFFRGAKVQVNGLTIEFKTGGQSMSEFAEAQRHVCRHRQ